MTSLLAFYSLLALALYALLGVYVRARYGQPGPALAAAMAFLAGLMAAVLVVLAVGGAR